MARRFQLHSNFSTGLVTPHLFTRADVRPYQHALSESRNFLPLPYGGLTTRPGTLLAGKVRQATATPEQLIPYVFNVEQTYMIEAGDYYFRFYARGQRVLEQARTVTAIAENGAGGIRVTVIGHGHATGDWVQIDGVLGAVTVNGVWPITVVDADQFELDGGLWRSP